jgi:hypothetical protein
MTLKVKGAFDVTATDTAVAIVDFDVRKAIVYQEASTTDFQFVTDPELATAVRLLDQTKVGSITGDCTDGVSGSDKIVVYAYKKGTYDVNMEKIPQGTSKVQFKNAVVSAAVAADGTFRLTNLEAGDYELHFVSYKTGADGRLQAKGELQMSIIDTTLDLLKLNVKVKTALQVDMIVTGILFF